MVVHLEGHPSSFWPCTATFNFSEANGTGWAACQHDCNLSLQLFSVSVIGLHPIPQKKRSRDATACDAVDDSALMLICGIASDSFLFYLHVLMVDSLPNK